jgi:hypothetical protein
LRKRELGIISWCGMRGIVSLAAALALPATLPGGGAFPHRDLIVFLTFFVIAVTLVGQGLTLPALIRRLKVGSDWSIEAEGQRVRAAMSAAAIAAIDDLVAREARRPNGPTRCAPRSATASRSPRRRASNRARRPSWRCACARPPSAPSAPS